MKKFLLKVEYECGVANMLVGTPDLIEAIQIYQNHVKGLFGRDKGSILPRILKAEILEVTYEDI